jgi:hypothetical protein
VNIVGIEKSEVEVEVTAGTDIGDPANQNGPPSSSSIIFLDHCTLL